MAVVDTGSHGAPGPGTVAGGRRGRVGAVGVRHVPRRGRAGTIPDITSPSTTSTSAPPTTAAPVTAAPTVAPTAAPVLATSLTTTIPPPTAAPTPAPTPAPTAAPTPRPRRRRPPAPTAAPTAPPVLATSLTTVPTPAPPTAAADAGTDGTAGAGDVTHHRARPDDHDDPRRRPRRGAAVQRRRHPCRHRRDDRRRPGVPRRLGGVPRSVVRAGEHRLPGCQGVPDHRHRLAARRHLRPLVDLPHDDARHEPRRGRRVRSLHRGTATSDHHPAGPIGQRGGGATGRARRLGLSDRRRRHLRAAHRGGGA